MYDSDFGEITEKYVPTSRFSPLKVLLWVFLASMLAVPLGCVCMFGLLLWSTAGPNPEMVLAKVQPACDQIIAALEEFHRRHGRYPQALTNLVEDDLLAAVPELPPHWGTSSRYGPQYQVNHSLVFYRLAFGYHVEGGIGPGDTYWHVFISDDKQGWRTTGSPVGMEDLVADRLSAKFRKERRSDYLGLFMTDVIGKAACDYLYQDKIVRWLGEGVEVEVPSGVPGSGRTGYIYQAEDDASERYCFVYKDHWLPVPQDWIPPHERGKFTDKNYPVLDELFLVRESEDSPVWTIIRECPKSPRDQRAVALEEPHMGRPLRGSW